MSSSPTRPLPPLTSGLMIAASVFAVGHLLAVGLLALAGPSGPWIMPGGGVSQSPGPEFATGITMKLTYPYYLEPVRMTHNYHFSSNRPAAPGVYFEVHLKNEAGEVTRVLKFPDEKANFWVRHRQEILAGWLNEDQQMPPRGALPVGGNMPKVEVWEREDAQTLRLKQKDELDLPRNQPLDHPSAWSKVLAHSYMRYLCREHKAKSAELVRVTRPPVMPMYLFLKDEEIKNNFTELRSHFGEYPRD